MRVGTADEAAAGASARVSGEAREEFDGGKKKNQSANLPAGVSPSVAVLEAGPGLQNTL